MTSMPTIDDRMVVLFRRTGKRQGSYAPYRSGRLAGDGLRVVPQRSPGCTFPGQFCTVRGLPGRCDKNLNCMIDPFPGPDFRL